MKTMLSALALALLATQATAAPITGTSGFAAPTVSGQTGIATFDTTTQRTYPSLVLANLTISGIDGPIRITNDYPGQYNGRGAAYLDNNAGHTSGIRFDFASLVSAFAFNWGASDVAWTLSAFDVTGHLLESILTPITNASNAGDYVGLSDAGIKYATLTSSSAASQDWVFIDNIVFAAAAVPEPASIALIGLGLAAVVAVRRRKTPGASFGIA